MEEKETCKDLQIKSVCALISEWTQEDQIRLIRSLMLKSKVYSLYNVLHSPSDIKRDVFYTWISKTCFPEFSNTLTYDFFNKAFELYDFILNETQTIQWGFSTCVSKYIPEGYKGGDHKSEWFYVMKNQEPKNFVIFGEFYEISFFCLMLCIKCSNDWEKDLEVILCLLNYKGSTNTVQTRIKEIEQTSTLDKYFTGLHKKDDSFC